MPFNHYLIARCVIDSGQSGGICKPALLGRMVTYGHPSAMSQQTPSAFVQPLDKAELITTLIDVIDEYLL